MRPVKAPRAVDRFLRSQFGLGFSEGYYQGSLAERPLSMTVHFGKHPSGHLVHLGVHYPVGEGGVQMNPLEANVLTPNGLLGPIPAPDKLDSFWDIKNQESVIGGLDFAIPKWTDVLSDAPKMIELFDYLLGLSGDIPFEFDQVQSLYLKRKETPNRLRCKACYLCLAGQYEDAKVVLGKIKPSMTGEAEMKMLSDIKEGRIQVPEESLAYLRSIGADA